MFEAVARIVRLLDTIKAPGSPGHLSRPSGEGKVVDRPVSVKKHGKRTGIGDRQQKRSLRKVGNHRAGALVFLDLEERQSE
jgi:hypothetical protein